MKKRNKKYNPNKHKVNPNAVFNIIQGVKPLSQDDKLHLFKQAFQALNRMQFGANLTKSDFTVLCDMLNISMLLASRSDSDEYLPELASARDAMQDSKQRYIKTNKLGFTASELKAVKRAFEIHNAQMDKCTYAEFRDAFDTQEKKIQAGDYYQREGDLKMEEMA